MNDNKTWTVNSGDEFDGDKMKYISCTDNGNISQIQIRERVSRMSTTGGLSDDDCIYSIQYSSGVKFDMEEHSPRDMKLNGQTLTVLVVYI